MPKIIKANAVEYGFEWVLFASQYFRGEGFSAVFAEIELDGFMLGVATAALYDAAAQAIGTMFDLAVGRLSLAGPSDVVRGF